MFFKKVFSLLLVVLLVAAVGCSNKPASDSDSNSANAGNSGNHDGDFDFRTAPMPTRDVEAKEITVYSWMTLEEIFGNKPKSIMNMFKKEFGITFKEIIQPYDQYWEQLATLKASGQSPDLVDLPNWMFYPHPITQNLIQPLDEFVDFSNPIWNDTKNLRTMTQWKGKTYIPFQEEYLESCLFFNKRIFKDNGLKDPQYYYEKDQWTIDKLEELAVELTEKDPSTGETTRWGFAMQHCDLLVSTGLNLVDSDGKGGYINNLKNAKVAKIMNLLYDLGAAGTNSYYIDDLRSGFASGKIAMVTTETYSITQSFNKLRLKGDLGWVPMPKIDDKGEYYWQTSFDPGYGIAVGAKNTQEAALFIEYLKWFFLEDGNLGSFLPFTEKNATSVKPSVYGVP